MNLKRQLLLVGLLTLVLPWAGCQYLRETESALRTVQQDMLAATARAIASSLSQYSAEFPPRAIRDDNDRLFVHPLDQPPVIDGYFDDWPLPLTSLEHRRGYRGAMQFAVGSLGPDTYLYVEVSDDSIVYTDPASRIAGGPRRYADSVNLISDDPLAARFEFAPEAPGPIVSVRHDFRGTEVERGIFAHWQETPQGYRLEARVPTALIGSRLGLRIRNVDDAGDPGTTIESFHGERPGQVARTLPWIQALAKPLVPDGMRMIVTDAGGWRLAVAGQLPADFAASSNAWPRRLYDLLLEPGKPAIEAEPDPLGREDRIYVAAALDGQSLPAWFRSDEPGRAIVAVAAPIRDADGVFASLILQQNTDAILSRTNAGLAQLIGLTLASTALVVGVLLGFATLLSRRIRRLSRAAVAAVDTDRLQVALPSADAGDEIGDLSRSFSSVLQQLGEYNAYLKTLASKLSHELRTPLTIVTSSLENLEHETLDETACGYVSRAREGSDRLRAILGAMSEASRVEQLMENAEFERFELGAALQSTTIAYADAYPARRFSFDAVDDRLRVDGSPELLIQMLDKLVDNAVDFSASGEMICIRLRGSGGQAIVEVENPGPPLPESMQSQLFDSMVSVRRDESARHLGLGLFIARMVAEGHGGSIAARNVTGGVCFTVRLPLAS